MIPTLLITLIPVLVSQAEKIFGSGTGPSKRAWVMEAIKEIEPLIKRVEPEKFQAYNEAAEAIIDTAIEFALDALEK